MSTTDTLPDTVEIVEPRRTIGREPARPSKRRAGPRKARRPIQADRIHVEPRVKEEPKRETPEPGLGGRLPKVKPATWVAELCGQEAADAVEKLLGEIAASRQKAAKLRSKALADVAPDLTAAKHRQASQRKADAEHDLRLAERTICTTVVDLCEMLYPLMETQAPLAVAAAKGAEDADAAALRKLGASAGAARRAVNELGLTRTREARGMVARWEARRAYWQGREAQAKHCLELLEADLARANR